MKRLPRLDLNPSSADRWTTCTASPQFIMDNHDKIPESTDTPYNMAGTAAHEVAAAFLQNRQPGTTPVPVDEDMLMHGWNYHEYVLGLREAGSRMLVEQKLPLWYMPARNCIVDAAVINPKNLHIVDYKYGEGVVVHPERSLQATIYAQTIGSGMLPFPPDDFPVFVHIYQPRGRAGETGPGHVWETTWGEIAEIAREINEKAKIIQACNGVESFNQNSALDRAALAFSEGLVGDSAEEVPRRWNALETLKLLEFAPSDKACQWCPAKGFCTARQASLAEGFEVIDALTPLPKPGSSVITLDQVSRVLTHKAAMTKWLEDVEEWAGDFMRAGGKIPGFKLVLSNGGHRAWTDKKRVQEILLKETVLRRDDFIEEKMLSPKGIEDLIGKRKMPADLTALITKPPGSPVIAPEGDKREAIMGAEDVFEVLPEGVK